MRCYQYLYLSLAARAFSPQEISSLARKAQINNEQIGITGMLIHADGYFMQVIEGDKHFVLHLVEIIRRDQRHTDLIPLLQGPASRRLFSNWSMGVVNLNALRDSDVLRDAQILSEFLTLSEPACVAHSTVAALRYMRTRFQRARERMPIRKDDRLAA